MLYRIILKNFLSFNDMEQFDLLPNPRRTTLFSHIYQRGNLPAVLKMSALYGANGAGKSNLISALGFVRRFVLDDGFLNAEKVKNNKFRLKPNVEDEPIFIAVEFEAEDNELYLYSVEIGENGVHSEALKTSGENKESEVIFERSADGFTLRNGVTEEVRSIVNKWIEQHPFASLFTINTSVPLISDESLTVVQKWFGDKLKVIGLNSFQPDIIHKLKNHPEILDFTSELFSKIGLGLSSINVKTEDFDKWLATNPDDEKILSKTKEMPEDTALSKIVNNRNVSVITVENGIRRISQLVFEQVGIEGYSCKMDIQSQSDGTVRLLILAPYLYRAVYNGATIVVDEIDNSIHPHLVLGLVKYFADKDTNGQLIFSTHETCVLDQEFLRPDEVWFVEKSEGVSHPYSLNDFKIHNTISIENGYLTGRFGAIPFIGSLDM